MLLINNKNCFQLNKLFNLIPNICNENVLEYMADGFCIYINKIGKNKGKCCGRQLRKKREYCYEHTYNTRNNNIKEKNLKNKKLDVFKSKKIQIHDPFYNNISLDIHEKPLERSLLICYNNENTIFKDYIRKNKKRIKNKNKKKNQKLNRLKNKNIKLEYIDEGLDSFGFPISNKIKSPFPYDKVCIKNIEYKCRYYTFSRIKKEIKLFLIRLNNNEEEIIFYDYYEFEKLLINVYNKDFVNEYFGL